MMSGVEHHDIRSVVPEAGSFSEDSGRSIFALDAQHEIAGDQDNAIEEIVFQLENGQERCVLLGVTGSGKTFAMAHVIERLKMPTLILSHNKTLARQLWQEMSALFPTNAVEYFVSHYDYYQPEAYIPGRDLYIDKELQMNERVEQERFSTVASLVSRPDVIAVGTVSAIYGLNPPETFLQHHIRVHVGMETDPQDVVRELVGLHYVRVSGSDFTRGDVRLRGDVLDVWMPSRDDPLRIRFGLDGIERMQVCESISWETLDEIEEAWIHPREFYITSPDRFASSLAAIEEEMESAVRGFRASGHDLEAIRLEQRTKYDLELLTEIGSCKGIENYSRHFDGREEGERPYCLLDFIASCAKEASGDSNGFLVLMDESHVTLPQLGGMHAGDRSRKRNLIEHGFRLPSAYDNRPLRIDEFQALVPRMVYVSATPGEREMRHLAEVTGQSVPEGLLHVPGGGGAREPEIGKPARGRGAMLSESLQSIDHVVRMEMRPTGLLDPIIEVRPTEGQVQNLLDEINNRVEHEERVLVTVLTIKFAEEVSDYLQRMGVKAHHLHSELGTIERSEVIKALRIGHIDVIVGINLLREGLDLPEVSLVAIFDADREGFLRNERSLLQTIGRAARNARGQVLLYADSISPAMESAISQTLERRGRQIEHNELNEIIPRTIMKPKPVMDEEVGLTVAGAVGAGTRGGKRLVAPRTSGIGREKDPVSRFGLGAGIWSDVRSGSEMDADGLTRSLGDVPTWAATAASVFEGEDPMDGEEWPASPDDSRDGVALVSTIRRLEAEMHLAAERLEFERAASIRDRIFQLRNDEN